MIQKIKKLCQEKGITINRVEKECGLSHAAIRHWDSHPPNVLRAKQVCDYLGITVDELLREE